MVSASAQLPPRARTFPPPPLPLAVGNQWVYVERGRAAGEPRTVEVVTASQVGAGVYFQLSGFAGGAAWVRYTATGDLVQWDPAENREKLWYAFSAPESVSWRPQLPVPCLDRASIRTRSVEVRVPAGVFSPSLTVEYQPGSCADAGFLEEAFAPGVGLLRRSEQTIAGPRTLELVFARVDGTAISGPELSFGLAMDRPVYVADLTPPVDPARAVPVLAARLTIRNTSALPLALQFHSGQQYDLAIRDSAGRQVFLWSEGKFFTQALTRLDLSPGEKTFLIEVPLADRSGRTFPEGRYTVEGWLTTSGGKLYSATVSFEIQHVF